MYKRILILLSVTLMATGCVHGVKRIPAQVLKPDLTIPPAQMAQSPDLPQPASGKRSALLSNHVAVARMYHALRATHLALVCSITGATGVTINGAEGVQPEACKVPDP